MEDHLIMLSLVFFNYFGGQNKKYLQILPVSIATENQCERFLGEASTNDWQKTEITDKMWQSQTSDPPPPYPLWTSPSNNVQSSEGGGALVVSETTRENAG